jgi:hypothetical protein
VRDRATRLARRDARWLEKRLQELPVPQAWSLETLCGRDEQGRHGALAAALAHLAERTHALAGEVGRRMFAHVGPVDHAVWQ